MVFKFFYVLSCAINGVLQFTSSPPDDSSPEFGGHDTVHVTVLEIPLFWGEAFLAKIMSSKDSRL